MKYSKLNATLIFSLFCHCILAQNTNLNLFLNCQVSKCYNDYLRTELSMFNFVRDQAEADVLILLTSTNTASGGRNYQIFFENNNQNIVKKDTLSFSLKQDATDDQTRKAILNTLSVGLLKYLNNNNLTENVKVVFAKNNNKLKHPKPDKWRNWVFGLGANGRLNGESNRKNVATDGNFRGGRTTEKSKFSFYSYYNQRTNSVKVDSTFNTVKVNDYGFNSLFVRAFSNHWSAGGFVKGFHSVYQNIKFSKSIAPALEYSVFPVQDFTRKQFRWIYQAGVRDFDYLESTVFDKMEETIPYQQLTGIVGFTENWGNFSAEVSGYQYLHVPDLYRLSLELDLTLRVAQGLSVRFYGNGSQINNQISLPKVSADATNVLLGGRQLATSFSYTTSFGINYTFGSVNNSVVNPRFSGVN
jgi:hypothetical protein